MADKSTNSILLLDEADIFLSQREKGDESVTRNAMVRHSFHPFQPSTHFYSLHPFTPCASFRLPPPSSFFPSLQCTPKTV
jgi:hypothetical protein